jgi:S-adenosylmethionine:tRNA ribosyltransferase-isomerase
MRTDELDFELPTELIAQAPVENRAASRLLHYRRADLSIVHRQFSDLPIILRAGDLLVFNDARVVPARFTLQKETGGLIEGLFLNQEAGGVWRVLLKNLGPHAEGKALHFADAPQISVKILSQGEEGEYRMAVESARTALEVLGEVGRMPLPPYIKRERHHDRSPEALDRACCDQLVRRAR